jgi:hypothetical protein
MRALLLFAALLTTLPHPARMSAPGTTVLVELFTSEGCSSCPPADTVLAKLAREQAVSDVEIIPLSFHVDYWDHQGWKDPFASKAFTARQQSYAKIFGADRVYTPQMVVDGRDQFPGSDEDVALRSIRRAASQPRLPLTIDARASGTAVRLSIDLPAAPPDLEPIEVMVALAEDDITSVVRRGENGGRTLTHVAVVRKLQALGSLERESFVATGQLDLARAWNLPKLRAVTWLEGRKSRHIYGAAAVSLVPTNGR